MVLGILSNGKTTLVFGELGGHDLSIQAAGCARNWL